MGASLVLEYAGELHIFVLRRRNGPITAKPHLTLDQSEGRKEKQSWGASLIGGDYQGFLKSSLSGSLTTIMHT